VEFRFDFASSSSYVAAMSIEAQCRRAGVELECRPFLLAPIFTGQLGIHGSPIHVNPVRGRYMWRDLERLCAKYALPWRRPGVFPRNSLLAARVACALSGTQREADAVRAIFRANFADDRDISDPHVLAAVLAGVGVAADDVLARAGSVDTKQKLRAQTEEGR